MSKKATQAAEAIETEDEEELGPQELRGEELKCALESLIFVSDQPVTAIRLARTLKTPVALVRPALQELLETYAERGIHLEAVAGGYQFRSSERYAPYVQGLIAPKAIRLTRAQLETLSIVAYRQPITRPEIDEIRGVDSGSALRVLAERTLLKILGRKDEPGRPLLYGTTPAFLEFFGLNHLRDLPTLKEFSELNEEHRELFERKTGETLDLHAAEEEAAEAEEAAQQEILEHERDDESRPLDSDRDERTRQPGERANVSEGSNDSDPRQPLDSRLRGNDKDETEPVEVVEVVETKVKR